MSEGSAAERFRQLEEAGPRLLPQLIGPASLLGVCLGMLAIGIAFNRDGPVQLLYAVPLLGGLLLPVAGHVRQLGTGLLASLAVWFVAIFAFISMYVTLEVYGLN